jgi:16S rRNA (cytidine1402-2'-O)-methyltransferase
MGKSVALVTDAGTPGVSDPGTRLVQEMVAQHVKVVPIPGVSSPIAALSASGWGADGFLFLGFLPRKSGKAKRALQEGLGSGKTTVVLESPFRVVDTLQNIANVAPQAQVIVARELTKIHEEFLRGTIEQVLDQLKTRPEKGEVVLLINPEPS